MISPNSLQENKYYKSDDYDNVFCLTLNKKDDYHINIIRIRINDLEFKVESDVWVLFKSTYVSEIEDEALKNKLQNIINNRVFI